MKFPILNFSVLPSAVDEGRRKLRNPCYPLHKEKKSQIILKFHTPVKIICRRNEVINSSSSLPNGTQTHATYHMAVLYLLVSNTFPFQYYVLLSLGISGDAVKAA